MDLDEALLAVGDFGKFQILNFGLLLLPVVHTAIYMLTYVFTARELIYRCRIPECDGDDNATVTPPWLPLAVPINPDGTPNRCLRYAPSKPGVTGTCTAASFQRNQTIECTDLIFPEDEITIVKEFNVTCDRNKWKLTIIGSVNILAQLLGMPLCGIFSDRFGRRCLLLAILAISGMFGIARSIAPSYYTFLTFEFLDALFASGMYSACFILGLELVGGKYRVIGGCVIGSFYSLGCAVLGLGAWLERDWRSLLRLIYAPILVGLVCAWMLPESVRWLTSTGQLEEAQNILTRAAKMNGRELSSPIKLTVRKSGPRKQSMAPGATGRRPSASCVHAILAGSPVLSRPATPGIPTIPGSPPESRSPSPERHNRGGAATGGRPSVTITVGSGTGTASGTGSGIGSSPAPAAAPAAQPIDSKPINPLAAAAGTTTGPARAASLCESIMSVTQNNRLPIIQVCCSPTLMLRLLITAFLWITNSFVYFGLALNSVSLAGDLYLNFILAALVEVPAYGVSWATSDRWGRKMSVGSALAVTGISLLSFLAVPHGMRGAQIFLYLMGKMAITWSFTVLYVFTAELFPTNARHSLLGLNVTIGRLGGMLAPQTPLLENLWSGLPIVLFGGMSLAAAALTALLPETLNRTLPDNVRQAEEVGKKKTKPKPTQYLMN